MVACGHTNEHLPHCMQFSGYHFGSITAMPLFSKAVVPSGCVPSSMPRNALTGSSSPSCLAMGLWIFFMNSSSISGSLLLLIKSCIVSGPSSAAFVHVSGTLTLCRASRARSTAISFISTIFLPFLPYDFSMESLRYLMASSTGIIFASLKNTVCMIMFILLPRPILPAMAMASIV